jgi:membrane-associated phospholipid phosphatase
MKDSRFVVGKIALGATDVLILGTLVLITLLTVFFHRRVDGWAALALQNLAAGGIYLAVLLFGGGSAKGPRRFFLRMAGVLFMMVYLNLAVDKLQLIFHGRWLDTSVLKMEDSLFGTQPTVWLQRFISKPLTEWMFFAYVFYLVLYPALAVVIFFRKGEQAAEDFFFTLGLTNVFCDLAFLAYPVAGPLAHMKGQYSVPLDGYVWTSIGEYLRTRWQFVGGTIPSPHCANATAMWLMAYRYRRPVFWALAPVILSLYASTVYCRYHYVTDSIAGIAAALLVWAVAPACRNAWNGVMGSLGSGGIRGGTKAVAEGSNPD